MKLYQKRALSEQEAVWWYSLEMALDGSWELLNWLTDGRTAVEKVGNYPTKKEAEAAREAHWQASPVPGLEEVELCQGCCTPTCEDLDELRWTCYDCQGSGVVPVEEKP